MESKGITARVLRLVLTTIIRGCSELERHVKECHPEESDTQRSVSIYKDIATTCSKRPTKNLNCRFNRSCQRLGGPSLTAAKVKLYIWGQWLLWSPPAR
ncbi:hypothetical protein NQ317_011269 [Molorchus minor]|uniref:Uncharacterized protein n=1 Tax=Molorchus minor TaxID=1323400 RepID=A0ABQ9JRJ0_9CUCU|nr:hypothetical protein NQ317_011269 [Molorchus minor]